MTDDPHGMDAATEPVPPDTETPEPLPPDAADAAADGQDETEVENP